MHRPVLVCAHLQVHIRTEAAHINFDSQLSCLPAGIKFSCARAPSIRNCTPHQELHPASGNAPCPPQTALVPTTLLHGPDETLRCTSAHFAVLTTPCTLCTFSQGKNQFCLMKDAYLVPSHLSPGGTPVCLMNDA